jgi:hypothetical protein
MLLSSLVAQADVYKCTDADGSITFQQTPCPKQKVEKVSSQKPESAEMDCIYANKFAVSTARLMRSGAQSDELFDRYGGLDSLSRATIGVINYVYSYRTSDNVTVERIAGLAQAKCRAGSFGDASCEEMPLSFTEGFGGCDAGENAELMAADQISEPAQSLTAATAPSSARSNTDSGRSPEQIQACKKQHRDAIDSIDAEMRRGYSSEQGEVYRERLRTLTERLRDC